MIAIGSSFIVSLFSDNIMPSMRIQPLHECADSRGGQSYTMVCRSVIHPQRVSIRINHMTARKDYVPNITYSFVAFMGAEDPVIAADQAGFRRLQIKKSQA